MQATRGSSVFDYADLALVLLRVYGATTFLSNAGHVVTSASYAVATRFQNVSIYLLGGVNPTMAVSGALLFLCAGPIVRRLVNDRLAPAVPRGLAVKSQ
jgi:hypothetical protein